MTEITFNQVYAIGLPIVLAMILLEVIISNVKNKSFYKKGDTLCTIGLLVGNIFAVYAEKINSILIYRIFDEIYFR